MSENSSMISILMTELRNRRVFRVSAVYLGVGYAILEPEYDPLRDLPQYSAILEKYSDQIQANIIF